MKNNFPLFRLYSTILFFISLSSFSQNQKPILQDFQEEYVRFENENKLDSINFLIQSYLEKENLNEIEKQLLYYYKGVHYTKINRYQEAIITLKKSVSLYNNFERSALLKKLSFYFIADAYFTLKDYKNAYFFAEKAKKKFKPRQVFKCLH